MSRKIEKALRILSRGGMIVITDDAARENEGDLVMAAQFAGERAVNRMIRYGRGLICVPIEEKRAKELSLSPMVEENSDPHTTAFTVSVDAVTTTTGISALDRSRTIRALVDPESNASKFRTPGHIFPLTARPGGLSERRGHTEASIELVRRITPAGNPAAAVICEILSRRGTMLRGTALSAFCFLHRLVHVSVGEIADYIRKHPLPQQNLRRCAETRLPTAFGVFRLYAYEDTVSKKEHLALVYGNPQSKDAPLCRIHSECLTGDVFGSKRCDCGSQLQTAMKRISTEGDGIIVYLRQEGRGIGLANKIRAYALQDCGWDTVDANTELGFLADERDYGAGAEILKDLGVSSVTLMTNNPAKIAGLKSNGIAVTQRAPIVIPAENENARYLKTKEQRMNHIFSEASCTDSL